MMRETHQAKISIANKIAAAIDQWPPRRPFFVYMDATVKMMIKTSNRSPNRRGAYQFFFI